MKAITLSDSYIDFLNRSGASGRHITSKDWTETRVGAIFQWPQSLKTALSMVLQSSQPMVLLWGRSGLLFHNESYATLVGCQYNTLGVDLERLSGELVGDFQRALTSCLQGEPWVNEVIIMSQRNVAMKRHFEAIPVIGEEGGAAGVLCTIGNATGEVSGSSVQSTKNSEDVLNGSDTLRKGLKSQNGLAELILDSIPSFISYVDTNERYVFANEVYEHRLGLKKQEIKGRKIYDIIGQKNYVRSYPYIKRALEGERVSYENRFEFEGEEIYTLSEYVPDIDEAGRVRGFVVLGHDVTDRKRAEQLYQSTHAQLQQALYAGDIDTWVYDINKDRLQTGLMIPQIFGLDQDLTTGEGIPLQVFIDAVHVSDRKNVQQHIKKSFASGDEYEVAFKVQHAGNLRRVILRGRAQVDLTGKPHIFSGVLMDVTRLKVAEEALKLSEERFRLISEATNDAIWDWDLVNSKAWWSNGLIALFGYYPEEIGDDPKWWDENIHPDDRDRVLHSIHGVINKGASIWSDEYRFRCEDGSYAEVLDRGYVLRDDTGRAVRMLGAMLDVTERNKTERALQASENQMKLITNALPSFISYIDKNQKYKFVNAAYEKWFDKPTHEILNKPMLEVLGETVYNRSRPYVEKALNGEDSAFETVMERRNKKIHISVNYVPDFAPDGTVNGFVVLGHDITPQKEAEEALRKSEVYYKAMTDNTPVKTWVTGPSGDRLYLNKQWYDYTGQEREEGLGQGWLDAVHPEDTRHSEQVIMEANLTQQPFTLEYRLRSSSGAYRWHMDTGFPKYDDSGVFEGYIGSVIDIHERKVAEEALQVNSARFELVVESSPNALLMVGEKGSITMVNEQSEKLFGYHREELVRISVDRLLPERYHSSLHYFQRRLAAHKGSTFSEGGVELHIRKKDSSEVPVELSLNTIRLDDELFVLCSVMDIGERKRAEQALRESEEFNRTLLESSPDCIKALDLKGRLLSINNQGLKMLEIDDFSQFYGHLWVDLWEGKYQKLAIESLNKAMAGGIGHFYGFTHTPLGTGKWWDVLVAPVYGAQGEVERLIAVTRDITKLKELEEQKDDFIGIASHELKTPVTSIKAYVEVLQRHMQQSDDLLAKDILMKVGNQLDRLTFLIIDLLDVTKIEQGKLIFHKTKFLINDLINETVEDLQRTAERHHIETNLSENIHITADKERIGQVLINLLENAIKYSPKANKIILRTDIIEGREVVFSIQDFGLGLSQENLSRIFERFYRAEVAGHETYPGLGLGLYISAGIVQRHLGRIWVESKEGEGSTFYFSLPMTEKYEE